MCAAASVALRLSAALPSTITRAEGVEVRPPVVVELFTSEGCSSCPPADALLQRLSDRRDGAPVIALGEHVDYWDHQGWKDRFSSAALTHRQELYAAHFANESIYTPQMVVDGRTEFVGSDASAAVKAIDRAAAARHGSVVVSIDGRSALVSVSALPPDHERADIVLAVTEDHLSSDVKRGENHGRVLAHAAVVRRLNVVGEATGTNGSVRADLDLDPSWKTADLKAVAFVQERRSRAILAAGVVPLVRP